MRRQGEGFVQSDIIEKLNRFARENGFEQVNKEGICNTLTMLYILAKEDGFAAAYLLELDDIVQNDDLPEPPAKHMRPSKEWLRFIKYINLAIFFQDTKQTYLPQDLTRIMRTQYALNMLSSEVQVAHLPEGSIRYIQEAVPMQASIIKKINLDKNELIELLKIIAHPGYLIKIDSALSENANHTIEIEFNGMDYIFFDSNYPDFVTKFSDINVLADEIINANFLKFGRLGASNFFPIEVQIFSRQAIPEFDRTAFIKKIMVNRMENGLMNRENYDGTTQLFNAIDNKDISTIITIIQSGADTIDYRVKESHRRLIGKKGQLKKVHPTTGMNAISYALAQGKMKIATLLIASLPDDDLALMNKTPDGNTLLHAAMESQRWEFTAQIIDKLSLRNPLIMAESDDGKSPLLLAIEAKNLQLVKLLLTKGADVNQVSFQSSATMTPLLAAIKLKDVKASLNPKKEEAKSIEIMELLVAAGANINLSESRSGLSHPLRVALDEGNGDAVRLILGHPEFNSLLSGVHDLKFELEKAYKEGKFKLVLILLENDLKPLPYPIKGDYLADLLYGHTAELNDPNSERYQIVSLLFNTADMSAHDAEGNTALHYALRSECPLDLVETLLTQNPDLINIANSQSAQSDDILDLNTPLSIVFKKIVSSIREDVYDQQNFNYYAEAFKLLLKNSVELALTQSCHTYLTTHCQKNETYNQANVTEIIDIIDDNANQIQRQSDNAKKKQYDDAERIQRKAHEVLLDKKDFVLHNKWQYTIFCGQNIEGKDSHEHLVKNLVPRSVKESILPLLANINSQFNPKVDYTNILDNYYHTVREAAKNTKLSRKTSTQEIYERESQATQKKVDDEKKRDKGKKPENKGPRYK